MNEQDAHMLLALLDQVKTDIVWTALWDIPVETLVDNIRPDLTKIIEVEDLVKKRYGVQ